MRASSSADLRAWADAMELAIASLRQVCDDPAGQVLRRPSPTGPFFDSPLARMYAVCDGLSLMELYVGYWIDGAERTSTAAARGGPVRVAGADAFDVTTFGSDGGGHLFVLRRDDGAVYHLVEAAVRDGVCEPSPRLPPARLAESIEDFLWLLLDDLRAHVERRVDHVYLVDRWRHRPRWGQDPGS